MTKDASAAEANKDEVKTTGSREGKPKKGSSPFTFEKTVFYGSKLDDKEIKKERSKRHKEALEKYKNGMDWLCGLCGIDEDLEIENKIKALDRLSGNVRKLIGRVFNNSMDTVDVPDIHIIAYANRNSHNYPMFVPMKLKEEAITRTLFSVNSTSIASAVEGTPDDGSGGYNSINTDDFFVIPPTHNMAADLVNTTRELWMSCCSLMEERESLLSAGDEFLTKDLATHSFGNNGIEKDRGFDVESSGDYYDASLEEKPREYIKSVKEKELREKVYKQARELLNETRVNQVRYKTPSIDAYSVRSSDLTSTGFSKSQEEDSNENL